MRVAVRRAVGVGGAAAVALGAAMALALPASAHVHKDGAQCYGDNAVFTVDLTNYNKYVKNTVTIIDNGTVVVDHQKFGSDFTKTVTDENATIKHTFVVRVVAGDDKPDEHGMGEHGFSFVDKQKTPVCDTSTTTTTTTTMTTTTTVPPTDTSTTTTTNEAPPPATTTSEAVVAAATTTPAPPGAPQLAFTGVNAALPIGIAAALVVAGGGILFWLRYNARRKTS